MNGRPPPEATLAAAAVILASHFALLAWTPLSLLVNLALSIGLGVAVYHAVRIRWSR